MQYSHFSVISGFPHKVVHLFPNFLAGLPAPTPYKVEIHASYVVCRVRGGVGPV